MTKLHPAMIKGFYDELEKQSADLQAGAEGVIFGALVGAALGGVGAVILEKLITRNRDIAIAAGALFGAGALGSAGFVLGKGKPGAAVSAQAINNPPPPAVPPRHQYTLR